jgi:hypothetical protein
MEGLAGILLSLVIVGLICYLLWWLIGYIALPAPFDKVARVLIAVFAVIYIIGLLTGSWPTFPILRFR